MGAAAPPRSQPALLARLGSHSAPPAPSAPRAQFPERVVSHALHRAGTFQPHLHMNASPSSINSVSAWWDHTILFTGAVERAKAGSANT